MSAVFVPTVFGSPAEVRAGEESQVTVQYAPETGSLQLDIEGLDDTTDADLRVSGPGGFEEIVSESVLLSGLTLGAYFLDARSELLSSHPVVSTEYRLTGDTTRVVEVDGGGEPAQETVRYEAVEGTGVVWLPLRGGRLAGLHADDLLQSGGPTPVDVVIPESTATYLGACAFDGEGALWVTSYSYDEVVKLAADALLQPGSPKPEVVLSGLPRPLEIAFDSSGNLWVTQEGAVVMISAPDLESSATVTPATTIITDGTGPFSPTGIALDLEGNLWVANYVADAVAKYSRSQLAVGGALSPDVTLRPAKGGWAQPRDIAFDQSGALWVSVNSPPSLIEFSPQQLSTTGNPVPATTITSANTAIRAPEGLAFDATGGLWVMDSASQSLFRFGPSQLDRTSAVVPEVVIYSLGLFSQASLAFRPTPPELPIRTP